MLWRVAATWEQQTNYTILFCAPEGFCSLAGIVYVLVRGTMFPNTEQCENISQEHTEDSVLTLNLTLSVGN